MLEKKRALVIDDEPKNLKLVKDLLEVVGYTVITAGDAEEGIALAKSNLPDNIVMDFRLPGMNGLQAYEILSQDERTKGIPIVFVTATVTNEEKKILLKTGCVVIAKPINTRTFAEEIGKILKEKKS